MNRKLLDFIRALSLEDRKSLSQKALKTTEEVGELAKKVLPFESAHATTHRFVEKRDILEECADTILCALSIAYDIGFDDEDIEDMMALKAEKWASLQAREAGVKYPVPFELHVTVAEAPSAQAFKDVCADLEVKPIFLALQDTSGDTVLHDVMTSSVCFGNNTAAVTELDRIADGLAKQGFEVLRRKIETVPWHPAAPSVANGVSVMPPGGYFECHLNILVEASSTADADQKRQAIGSIARDHGAHLSRNIFKRLSDDVFTVMTTLRCYDGTRETFEAKRDDLAAAYVGGGFKLDKLITEFSLFDSRSSHDASWLRAA